MPQMISYSHWGMFEQRGPVLLVPSDWMPAAADLKPGQMIRINGQPHQCVAIYPERD